jgi:FixJ family two-component response regulator
MSDSVPDISAQEVYGIHVAPVSGLPADYPAAGEQKLASRLDTVAIVDDDISVCDSLAVFLETCGFATRSYTSGAEFLVDEHRCRIDCLILDQHMPRMDGLDLLAALKAQDIQVPAILITGRLDSAIRERADRLGIIAILEKPFRVARLVDLIRGAVHGRS